MKNIFFLFSLILIATFSFAQQQDAKTLDETAKTFIRQGDYTNALVVLNRALQQEPKNIELLKDLAFAYYLDRNFEKALATAKPLTERADADVQSFQILGMVYKATEERKDCEKMYKEGLKKFPKSGVLHNEYGEVLGTSSGPEAIRQWEKGIEVDPSYSTNYYNASKYYYAKNNKIWCVLYGEIFVNIESYSNRTAEIKDVISEAYKKIFADAALLKNQGTKNAFESAFINELNNHANAISNGVNAESLTVLRTEFVLSWFDKPVIQFPFRLFDYHRQLLKEGLFNAYNQWLFGAAQNLAQFQAWSNTHADEYNKFIEFQKGRIFKLPEGQYYQIPIK
ncbi:MAG TPA: tetratricopeptide repeat protein [Puia sp.]|nr:tetratricopeptide repeat protein [Puia sp.]